MDESAAGGWMVGGLASPSLRKACCVCGLLSLFRASAQAKVPDPAARERLHPTGCGQARYVTDGDPIAKGGRKTWEYQRQDCSPEALGLQRAGSGMLMLI